MKRANSKIRNLIRYTIPYACLLALLLSAGNALKAQQNLVILDTNYLVADISGYVVSEVRVNYDEMNMITDFEFESELMIEEWMVDSENWVAVNRIDSEEAVIEEELEIEDWMTRSFFTERQQETFVEEEVAEEELKLESWMLQKGGFIHKPACN